MDDKTYHLSDERTPMPTSFDIASMSSIVPYIGNLNRLENNNIRIDGEPSITVNVQKKWVTVRGQSSQVTFYFNDTDGVSRRSRADAVFDYTMCKLAEMYQTNQVNGREIIVSYPIKDLVDIGLYEDVRTARRGFEKAMKALQSIQISGSKRIRKGPLGETMTHLISSSTIEKGVAKIRMGDYINWRSETRQFVRMPITAFSLDSKPYRLVKALYRLIRLHHYTTWFKVSLRFVAMKANIPIDYHNPTQTKKIVMDTINDVKKHSGLCIGIKPIYADYNDLDDWLKHGFITIIPKGHLLDDMTKLVVKQNQKLSEV